MFFYFLYLVFFVFFFFSSRRRHTRSLCDWSSDVCSSDLGDAQARMDVETQLRSTNQLVTRSTNAPESPLPSLMDGSVISVKDEWSFVVGNLGERQGVKIGMPMRVMRDDRKIATLRVVDVRQKICGAVIQEMDSEKQKIRVGD